jgi:hypothetical protein
MYFASGSNSPSEIRGFAAIGHPVGVSAAHLSPAGEQALHELAGRGIAVFVDSGAFSEVVFKADGPPVVVRPMTDATWASVMGLYRRLAASLGSALYVVAPDRIGDQGESLRRLRRWRSTLVELRQLGANIIVPIQRGDEPQARFDERVEGALGFDDYIRGIPSKKKATSLAELKAFVEARRPARVHLLGMGLTNRQFEAFATAARRYGAALTCDSNLLKASVGRTNGRANHPDERLGGRRVYTRAQDLAREVLAEGLAFDGDHRELAVGFAFAAVPPDADRWALIERQLGARRVAA